MKRSYLLALSSLFIGMLGGTWGWSAPNNFSQGPTPPKEDPYTEGAVHNTIKKKASDLQRCYLDFLKRHSENDGSIKSIHLDWQITSSGKVIKPELVDTDVDDSTFVQCLIHKIKGYEFPPPPTERNFYVNHYFRFKKEEPTKGPIKESILPVGK